MRTRQEKSGIKEALQSYPDTIPNYEEEFKEINAYEVSSDKLSFLSRLAGEINVSLDFVKECYAANDGRYDCMYKLRAYLINNIKKEHPALSLEEVLRTTQQEKLNLCTAYLLIREKRLSIEDAKKLCEVERLCILSSKTDVAWEQLKAYKEKLNRYFETETDSLSNRSYDSSNTMEQNTEQEFTEQLELACTTIISQSSNLTGLFSFFKEEQIDSNSKLQKINDDNDLDYEPPQ